MPRYHFNIVDGVTVPDPDGLMLPVTVPDPEGVWLPDEADAKLYAEYLIEKLTAAELLARTVQVSDDEGRYLFEVRS